MAQGNIRFGIKLFKFAGLGGELSKYEARRRAQEIDSDEGQWNLKTDLGSGFKLRAGKPLALELEILVLSRDDGLSRRVVPIVAHSRKALDFDGQGDPAIKAVELDVERGPTAVLAEYELLDLP